MELHTTALRFITVPQEVKQLLAEEILKIANPSIQHAGVSEYFLSLKVN